MATNAAPAARSVTQAYGAIGIDALVSAGFSVWLYSLSGLPSGFSLPDAGTNAAPARSNAAFNCTEPFLRFTRTFPELCPGCGVLLFSALIAVAHGI